MSDGGGTSAGDIAPLRVFVAMPGSNMGDVRLGPEQAKAFFTEVCRELGRRLDREVEPIIEVDKRKGGVIHDSMFREAYEAEVYIADLTNLNPNVFLELGVRYALSRGVTVVVSQDSGPIPFNVASMRTVRYGKDRLDHEAIREIVDFIEAGLSGEDPKYCDSPVMSALDLEVVPREEWENVSGNRVRDLLRRARQARFENNYAEAIERLREAIGLDPGKPALLTELGECYRGSGDLTRAAEAHREAVRLAPDDPGARSALGGALRRIALKDAPDVYDRDTLVESLHEYEVAYEANHHDTYAGLNVAKTRLLLSKWDKPMYAEATALFEKLGHLCAFKAADEPSYWNMFDLGDTQVLLGKVKAALDTYAAAIEKVPLAERRDRLNSPRSSLKELVEADVLKGRAKSGAAQVIELLEVARKGGGDDGS